MSQFFNCFANFVRDIGINLKLIIFLVRILVFCMWCTFIESCSNFSECMFREGVCGWVASCTGFKGVFVKCMHVCINDHIKTQIQTQVLTI